MQAEAAKLEERERKRKEKEDAAHKKLMRQRAQVSDQVLLEGIKHSSLVEKLLEDKLEQVRVKQIDLSGVESRTETDTDWDVCTGIYYYNRVTGERTFTKPPMPDVRHGSPPNTRAAPPPPPRGLGAWVPQGRSAPENLGALTSFAALTRRAKPV